MPLVFLRCVGGKLIGTADALVWNSSYIYFRAVYSV
uniref:Uncharacterized protein n=1 Tax=Anguilla anguilla TaxID=7936 RepID=A0A0E9UBJ0_ANGAN